MQDATGFAEIFHAHYEAIYAFCLRRLDHEDARDVTAEVFETAWSRFDDLDHGEARAWLYGVARNKVAHRWRANGRRASAMERLRSQPLGSASDDPERQVIDAITLVEAASNLSPDDLELLQLISWEGLGPNQLAIVLDCAPGTASVRVHRMRERLRTLIEQVQSVTASGN